VKVLGKDPVFFGNERGPFVFSPASRELRPCCTNEVVLGGLFWFFFPIPHSESSPLSGAELVPCRLFPLGRSLSEDPPCVLWNFCTFSVGGRRSSGYTPPLLITCRGVRKNILADSPPACDLLEIFRSPSSGVLRLLSFPTPSLQTLLKYSLHQEASLSLRSPGAFTCPLLYK